MGVWQSYPQNTFFSNFTQRFDELDFWFRLDPKYNGLGDFQIKFLAVNAQELDYVIDPDLNVLSYPNQTFGYGDLANQASVKYILLGNTNNTSKLFMAQPGTWVHFKRDVTADWTAQMKFYNGTANLSVDPNIKFVDNPPAALPNGPGNWTQGETVVYDADSSGSYTTGDLLIAGSSPAIGTNLSVGSKIKFVDTPPASSSNSPGNWSPGKTVVYDADFSGSYTAGDILISGTAPVTCSPCLLPGFPLTDQFYRVEFDLIGYQNSSLGTQYGMTAWIDNVNFYWDSNTPAPPPPMHFLKFNFTDSNRVNIDQYVKWRVFNSTSDIGPYTRGSQTLPDGDYTLEAYYPILAPTYSIYHARIPFDTNITIPLSLLAEPMSTGKFVTFSPTVLNSTTLQQDSSRLLVNVKGSMGTSYTMFAGVPYLPKAIVRSTSSRVELIPGQDWTYDAALSIVTVTNVTSATYEIYLQEPARIPIVTFTDRAGTNVNGLLVFNMTNSLGAIIPMMQHQITPDENYPYYLQAYYQGHRIYRNTVDFGRTTALQLQMLPLSSGYLVVNSTVVGINITGQSTNSLTFELTGSGPFLILVKVPQKPLYAELNGARIFWSYDGTARTAIIETPSQGTVSLVYTNPPTQPPLNNPAPDYANYFISAIILAASIVASIGVGIFFTRKRNGRVSKVHANLPNPRRTGRPSIRPTRDASRREQGRSPR